jgi:predicted methyltransferase
LAGSVSKPDSTRLARAIARAPVQANLEFAVSKRGDVCIESQTVDLAYMMQVQHYILRQEETQAAFADSLFESLRPGGEFVIIQHNDAKKDAASADRLFGDAGFEIGRKFRIWDREDETPSLVMEYRRPLLR